jgi:hypothetical protein
MNLRERLQSLLPQPALTASEHAALQADGLLELVGEKVHYETVPLDPRLPRGIAAPLLQGVKPYYQEGD